MDGVTFSHNMEQMGRIRDDAYVSSSSPGDGTRTMSQISCCRRGVGRLVASRLFVGAVKGNGLN